MIKRIIDTSKVTIAVMGLLLFYAAQAFPQDQTTSSVFPALKKSSGLDELKPHLGLQLGYAEPGKDYSSALGYGLEVGFQPYIPIGVALRISHYSTDGNATAGDNDLDRTKLLAKGTYNFGGYMPVIRNSYVGTELGAIFDSLNGNDQTRLGWGFLAGVDFPINELGVTQRNSFSLGADINYLVVFNARDDFSLNGNMKYWF